jgi:hypothetical protein
VDIAARPLTVVERATLDYLLVDAIDDVAALRDQAANAFVTGMCDCGCATVDLTVPPDAKASTPSASPDRVIASALSRRGVRRAQLLLHVLDGRLTELEIVDVDGSGPQPVFPAVSTWEPPIVGRGPDTYRWDDDGP